MQEEKIINKNGNWQNRKIVCINENCINLILLNEIILLINLVGKLKRIYNEIIIYFKPKVQFIKIITSKIFTARWIRLHCILAQFWLVEYKKNSPIIFGILFTALDNNNAV